MHETRAQKTLLIMQGFHGIETISIDGANFTEGIMKRFKSETIRTERRPF
jgi:2-oxoisovalerate dehydrogenase E1 component